MGINDNFNSFNSTTWRKNHGPHTGDLACQVGDDASIFSFSSNGMIIYLRDESDTECAPNTYFHTGSLRTNAEYQYGYFETYLKMPSFYRAWSNFFTLGGTGTYDIELDIAEYEGDGNSTSNRYNLLPAWHNWINGAGEHSNEIGKIYKGSTVENSFHVYGGLWQPGKADWFYDSQNLWSKSGSQFTNGPAEVVIRSGVHNRNYPTNPTLPSCPSNQCKFEVKYVKVWQLRSNCSGTTTVSNYNPSSHTHKVENNLVVNGGNVTSSQVSVLRASNTVTLNGDFTVNSGSDFYILPTPCYNSYVDN